MDKKISQFSNNAILLNEDEVMINQDLVTYKIPVGNIRAMVSTNIISTIIGPKTMVINQTFNFKISNYDMTLTYNIIPVAGSLSVNKDLITYIAPNVPGLAGFVINGRYIKINIIETLPTFKPSILIPVNNSLINTQSYSFQINDYQTSYEYNCEFLDSSNDWESTSWELATDLLFTNIVAHVTDSLVDVNTWTVNTLSPNTTYYVRARYKGILGSYSDWSNANKFKTDTTFALLNEQAILLGDSGLSEAFGYSIAISKSGDRIIVSSHFDDTGSFTNCGAVYIFFKSGVNWIREAKLLASDKIHFDAFGISVAIDGLGERVIIGSYLRDSGGLSDSGAAYIFKRTGTTWAQEQILIASDKAAGDRFGYSVDIDNTGTRVIIGAERKSSPGINWHGGAYIFIRSGTAWSEESILLASDKLATDLFGTAVAIDSTGTRVIIGAYLKDSGASATGGTYVYARTGVSWTQEQIILSPDSGTFDRFGISVDIDSTGTRVIIGAYFNDVDATSDTGSAYIFKRIGTTWSQETMLSASIKATEDQFGWSVAINDSGTRVAIGANYRSSFGMSKSGAIYTFGKYGETWTEEQVITASNNETDKIFGNSISMNSTGSIVVTGSPSRFSQGSGYIFS